MKRQVNWYLSLGMLFVAVPLGVSRFVAVPDFVHGFCIGVGIALTLLGLYATSTQRADALRVWKRRLVGSLCRIM